MRGVIGIFGILLSFLSLSAQAQKLNFDWAKSFGGDEFEASRFMKVDIQGNIYLFGETHSTEFKIDGKYLFNNFKPNIPKGFLLKYSKNGELLWSKVLFNDIGVQVLGLDIDINQNIILTVDFYGNFINSDSIKFTTNNNSTASNVFIIKLDQSGRRINHKVYSSLLSEITTYGGVTHDGNNNYYLAGSTEANIYGQNTDTIFKRDRKDGKILFIMKMDSQLNIFWIKSFGGKGDQIFDVSCDHEDNLIVYGWYRYRTLTIDSLMVNNYTKEYTPVVGYGDQELFITKLDSNGKAIWLKTISGSRDEYPSYDDITIDPDGNIYLGGLFKSDTLFFNENVKLIRTKNELDQFDLFYAKFGKNGECKWARKINNGKVNIDDMSIHLLKNGNLIITGNYDSTAFRTGTVILPNNGQNDCFILLANNEGEILSGTSFGGEGLEWDQQIATYDTSIYIFSGFSSKELKINDEVLTDEASNGDGLFIKLHIDSLTSLIDFKPVSENIIVYPNPVSDELFVNIYGQSKSGNNTIFELTNNLGESSIPESEKINENEFKLKLSKLINGIYYLSVNRGENKKVVKIIVNH